MENLTKDWYLHSRAITLCERIKTVKTSAVVDDKDRDQLVLELAVNTLYGILRDMAEVKKVKESPEILDTIENLIDIYEGNDGDWRTLLFEYIYERGLQV